MRLEDFLADLGSKKGAPGGDDYHGIWISPDDSNRMIIASDQGTIITLNGGKTWSSWYNQPTAQFYHVACDDRFPYLVYRSQQDNSSIAAALFLRALAREGTTVAADAGSYTVFAANSSASIVSTATLTSAAGAASRSARMRSTNAVASSAAARAASVAAKTTTAPSATLAQKPAASGAR